MSFSITVLVLGKDRKPPYVSLFVNIHIYTYIYIYVYSRNFGMKQTTKYVFSGTIKPNEMQYFCSASPTIVTSTMNLLLLWVAKISSEYFEQVEGR
jgi:hypothetical protein